MHTSLRHVYYSHHPLYPLHTVSLNTILQNSSTLTQSSALISHISIYQYLIPILIYYHPVRLSPVSNKSAHADLPYTCSTALKDSSCIKPKSKLRRHSHSSISPPSEIEHRHTYDHTSTLSAHPNHAVHIPPSRYLTKVQYCDTQL